MYITGRSQSRAATAVVCLVGLAAFHRAASAQTPQSATPVVTDSLSDSATPPRPRSAPALAPLIIQGTRLSDVDRRLPTRIDVLDITRDASSAGAAADALHRLPGIATYDDQGARLQPNLEVRGFAISPVVGSPQGVSVFLDGVRINEPDAQEVNFDLIPMAAVDHATLVRGPDVLFGRNSLGGTLLFATRRGNAVPNATFDVSAGSYGERTATITAGGQTRGFDGFAMASGSQETGWRQTTSAVTRTLFATVGHRDPNSNTDIAFTALYAHDRIFEAGSLPEDTWAANPRENFTPNDFFRPNLLQLSLRGTHDVVGGTARATIFDRRNTYEQYNANFPPPNSDAFVRNLSLGGTAEWTRPFMLARLPIALTIGGEYARHDVHFTILGVGNGPDSVMTLAGINDHDAGLFAQAVATPTMNLSITGAVRADYVHIPYRDKLDATNDGTSTYRRVTPQLGVTYQITNTLRAFAGYAGGFRAPAPLELACSSPDAPCSLPSALGADPPLKPVTTNNYQTGLGITLPHGTSLDASIFRTDVANDILFASPDLTHVYFINVPHTRRAGFESDATVPLIFGTHVFGSYSYIASTFQSTAQIATADTSPIPAQPGNIFPASPLHRGRIGLGATHTMGQLFADAEIEIQAYSKQYARGDEANQRAPVPGYAVSSFTTHIDAGRYSARVTIENLTNRRYATFGVLSEDPNAPDDIASLERFLTPGLPRRVTLSLSTRL